jgi:hypothetical protein
MYEIMRQPAEWREKATEYLDKSKFVADLALRQQFTELAARYLDMAEKFEDRMCAAAILNTRKNRRRKKS